MSHDSGFRRGSHDFTHAPPKRRKSDVSRSRTSRYADQQRLREQDRDRRTEPREIPETE